MEPNDGLGWYIIEGGSGRRALRHWTRYNLREAAISWARFSWPGEALEVGFWDGQRWTEFHPAAR